MCASLAELTHEVDFVLRGVSVGHEDDRAPKQERHQQVQLEDITDDDHFLPFQTVLLTKLIEDLVVALATRISDTRLAQHQVDVLGDLAGLGAECELLGLAVELQALGDHGVVEFVQLALHAACASVGHDAHGHLFLLHERDQQLASTRAEDRARLAVVGHEQQFDQAIAVGLVAKPAEAIEHHVRDGLHAQIRIYDGWRDYMSLVDDPVSFWGGLDGSEYLQVEGLEVLGTYVDEQLEGFLVPVHEPDTFGLGVCERAIEVQNDQFSVRHDFSHVSR